MPRHLQGQNGAEYGKSGKGSGKGKGEKKDYEAEAALPVQCMGEEGRDYLRGFLQSKTNFAQKVMADIDRDGYCVLSDVFSAAEMDKELDRAWGFVERVSPSVKRTDRNTWWSNGVGDPWPHAQRDMMQLHQAGWVFSELREKFSERVFESIFETKELHCSKDGFTFQRPTYGDLQRTPNDHFDQGPRWMGLQCIQGSVALTDQADNDGCFSVWPGSHQYREEICSAARHQGQKARRSDFIIMSDNEKDLLKSKGIKSRRVPVKRGSVILWRSDVAHCGAPPLGACDTYRVVVYICCLPAALTPDRVYLEKKRAYDLSQTGGHYPTREEWFEMTDRHRKMDWKPYWLEPPKLPQRQQQLYGLVRYDATSSSSSATSTNVVPGAVSGLLLAQMPVELVRAALVELRPTFRPSANSESSDMFEIGWSFRAMDKQQDRMMLPALSLADFPSLRALLEVALVAFSGTKELREDALNIICRRYTKYQGIPFHVDRPNLFEEDVYGCVLLNTSDVALEFVQRSRAGEVIAGPHRIAEQPGTCFKQSGDARTKWQHGVEPLCEGERISVTWRWIQQTAAEQGHKLKDAKGKSYGKGNPQVSKGKVLGKGSPQIPKESHKPAQTKENVSGNAAESGHSTGPVANASDSPELNSNTTAAKPRRWGRRLQQPSDDQ